MEAGKLEHDRSSSPNQGTNENQHKSSYIDVPTFWSRLSLHTYVCMHIVPAYVFPCIYICTHIRVHAIYIFIHFVHVYVHIYIHM